MCGILGYYGKKELPIDQELNLLTHRGPDHQEIIQVQDVRFGHTRLAIVDLDHGQQPLQSADGRYHLICNGEIYNHLEIRQQLSHYPFKTNTDSEVILALYQEYGREAITHLDGMFAFALYDQTADEIYLGRDPIGIKPLYYGWQDGILFFSSEVKAIQHHCTEIKELPPGHYYTTKTDEFVCYYDLAHIANSAHQQSAHTPPTIEEIYATLKKAVNKRLMSDVPLGVYLSGGLDSTIVAALVAQEKPDVHSFSVGVEGSTDIENARVAAKILGTQHHEYIYDLGEALAVLPEVIYHLESFDPLLVRSAIPNYFLAKLTRQYVTVVLTGEGADELYAGYHYLKQFKEEQLHNQLVNLTGTLYNCNLQRCDRMTMAHSIEGRVPFLDTEFIELSMRVPLSAKIEQNENIEKYILRKAFEGVLPSNVAWRVKEQFSKGAGSSGMLEQYAAETISDEVFEQETAAILTQTGRAIPTKETLLYYREFKRFFTDSATQLVQFWQGVDVV